MTRDDVINAIVALIQTDANLIILLRGAVTKNLPNVDNTTLNNIYVRFNPDQPRPLDETPPT